MKQRWLLATVIGALWYCTPGTPGGGSPVDWPVVVQCSPDVGDLVGIVTQILFTNGGESADTISASALSALEDLGREHGFDTIACLVDALASRWSAPGAAQTPERSLALARARDLLETEHITVEHIP